MAPAWAGFEWVAPSEQAPGYPAPVVIGPPSSAAPEASQGPEIISPVVIEGTLPPPSSAPSAAPVTSEEPSPASAPAPLLGSPVLAPIPGPAPASASAPQEEVVHGFADNVPLAVALRQVLPPGYNFSIDQDVDMGTPVSFKGGKPWHETLDDMLETVGLATREENHTVFISSSSKTAAIPAKASSPVAIPTGSAAAPEAMPAADLSAPAPALAPIPIPVPMITAGSMPVSGTWSAPRGDTLHKILQDWCRQSGTELDWLAEYDYPLQASVSFNGSFDAAVRNLLSGFEEAHPQPVAVLHDDPNASQKVLVVETRGNAYNE